MTPKESFDERTADYLTDVAQRLSRRSLIARVGQVLLWMAGASLVTLPVNRVEAQGNCGGAWCGLCGRKCKECCGGTVHSYICPSCTTQGAGYWTKCCQTGPCTWLLINYYDCCSTDPASADCVGDQCSGNCPQPAWCDGPAAGKSYRCTVISAIGNC